MKRLLSLGMALLLCVTLLAACGGDDSSVSVSSAPPTPPPVSAPSVPLAPGSSSEAPVSVPPVSLPPSSVVSGSSVPSEPPPQPAPVFIDGAPQVTGLVSRRVSVTFKTDVSSTVNAVVANVGTRVSTAAFYDYTRRGIKFEGAISYKSTYNVSSAGVTETYDLPDTSVAYYLIVNAVENATGTWQSGTTVLLLYDPAVNAPSFATKPIREADTDAGYVWLVETNQPIRVWALVVATGATAPTAEQVRNNTYPGTSYGHYSLDTGGDVVPYTGKLVIPKNTLGAGNYSIWYMAQPAGNTAAPSTIAEELVFTVS